MHSPGHRDSSRPSTRWLRAHAFALPWVLWRWYPLWHARIGRIRWKCLPRPFQSNTARSQVHALSWVFPFRPETREHHDWWSTRASEPGFMGKSDWLWWCVTRWWLKERVYKLQTAWYNQLQCPWNPQPTALYGRTGWCVRARVYPFCDGVGLSALRNRKNQLW